MGAEVQLTQKQHKWFCMGAESVPHASLAIHPNHQAREMLSMVKQAQTDWQSRVGRTFILSHIKSTSGCCIHGQ